MSETSCLDEAQKNKRGEWGIGAHLRCTLLWFKWRKWLPSSTMAHKHSALNFSQLSHLHQGWKSSSWHWTLSWDAPADAVDQMQTWCKAWTAQQIFFGLCLSWMKKRQTCCQVFFWGGGWVFFCFFLEGGEFLSGNQTCWCIQTRMGGKAFLNFTKGWFPNTWKMLDRHKVLMRI